MIPSVFMLLDELPMTPNGKVDRKALPAPVQTRKVYEAPRTKLESILVSMWEKMLNINKVGIHDDFFELGGNSLKAAIFTNQLEEALGEKVRVVVLFKAPDVAALASYLTEFHADAVSKMCAAGPSHFVDGNKKPASQRHEDLAASPLIEIQPEGSKRPLFCVHPIGGHVYCYADLARYLGVDRPFYGLQSIGLRGEREPHTRIADMAAEYVKALQVVQPQGPYLLGGYSFGSLVAFEMAQQLLMQGQTVARLALFDTEISNLSKRAKEEERTDDVTLLRNVFQNLPPIPQQLRHLGPDERLAYMMELAKTNNVIPSDFEFSQARNFLKVLRANVAAAANYIPQPYAGEITFFRALERPPTETRSDPSYGSNGLGNRGVTVYEVPGNHVSMFLRPYVESLAAELKSCLDEDVQ
jgi:thioesterase domain-containing protein